MTKNTNKNINIKTNKKEDKMKIQTKTIKITKQITFKNIGDIRRHHVLAIDSKFKYDFNNNQMIDIENKLRAYNKVLRIQGIKVMKEKFGFKTLIEINDFIKYTNSIIEGDKD